MIIFAFLLLLFDIYCIIYKKMIFLGEVMSLFKKKKNLDTFAKIYVKEVDSTKYEDYNRLKDNVLYMNVDGNTKVIQVESSLMSEGKTTLASNLAVSLGLTNKKVVVVDIDFRRPKLHRMFSLSKDVGVAEYVLEDKKLEEVIKTTEYKNVDVITRGAKVYNSSLLLVSDKFKKLIVELREKYDFVFLDCAPVLQVSDYIHVSKVSDGVLFLVAYGLTTKTQVFEAVKQLKQNNANILGTVFTMYDNKGDKASYNKGNYYKYRYVEQPTSEEE